MEHDIQNVWAELAGDLATPVIYWQIAVVVLSGLVAWMLNQFIQRRVHLKSVDTWRVGAEGVKRVMFPLTTLALVEVGRLVLPHWHMHVSLLRLSSSLLLAMAVIRLAVYALRYVFAPSGWLHTTESAIVTVVWGVFAMHVTGILPELIQVLDEVSFHVGKNEVSLWLILQALFVVLVTIVTSLWISRLIENRLMRAEQINMNLRVVMTKLVRIVLTLVGVLVALSAVGFDITLLSVFGGALGVGLGFGLQKIASNYVSGFIILLDQSIHLGDIVTINEHYGVVQQIRSRYMVLHKLDGTEVIIPNETLISSAVINHSLTDRKARVLMPVQVSYEGDLELAMATMLQVAQQHPRVLQTPAPEVQVKGFGDNGINLQLAIWIPDPEEGSAGLQSSLYVSLWREFKAKGISLPYPQRDIRIVSQPA
jgi:small-conductance mechanosensitive channel